MVISASSAAVSSGLHCPGIQAPWLGPSLVASDDVGGSMSGRWSSAGTYDPREAADQQETAGAGYFAALAPARYVQVATFGRDGRPVPARVHGVVDDGRAYFAARSRSGTVRRLRHADAVKVAPCSVLGLCYGPPLEAAARLLPPQVRPSELEVGTEPRNRPASTPPDLLAPPGVAAEDDALRACRRRRHRRPGH